MKTTLHLTPRRFHRRAGAAVPNTPNSVGREKIDPRWAWHYRTLMHLRERLLAAHDEHAAAVASAPEMTGFESGDDAREELDRDVLWAELGAENDRLFEIDAALNRIREGRYGLCEENGKPIAAARLRAIPWTRYCHAAALAAEKRRGRALS